MESAIRFVYEFWWTPFVVGAILAGLSVAIHKFCVREDELKAELWGEALNIDRNTPRPAMTSRFGFVLTGQMAACAFLVGLVFLAIRLIG